MSYQIELGSIRCFVVVAEELHFRRAAIRLNMSQPTLTQQVRRLEDLIGVRLFIRSTRRVELTPAGNAFLPHSREILHKLGEAILNAKLEAGGLSPGGEELIIGAISPATSRLLPLVLSRFRGRYPSTRLVIKEVDSIELLRGIERGDFHVGLMRPPSNSNLVRLRHLISERFVAVIPRQSILAKKPALRLSDFVGHSVFALKRFDLSSFETVWEQLSGAGLLTESGIAVSDTTTALALVTAGVGITFLPEWVSAVANDSVVTRLVEDMSVEISMAVGWNPDSPVPGILPFVEYATLAAQSMLSA
ncbi:LysR family transcriptional regulator [Mesorhizobium loti]|uniref:LysR family transcriptional regulator n=1 Tax=Mesorhizobium TaxID=68287 RepID=UPI000BB067BB|nr:MULTISPECIES: LysR family transcriptional regulator [Mesorhizobium]PBB11767.1 LysR family transcriptional regulator [Mesorhizobium loti]PBC07515.1 LysR family transcriptional regulator [Mesorhizobium sp. WSM3859]